MDEEPVDTSSRRWVAVAVLATIAVAGGVAAAALWWRDDRTEHPSRPRQLVPAPEVEPVVTGDYEWRPLAIGAGGFVTGLVTGVRDDEAVLYARTDVGGAYRWDAATGTWRQMLVAGALLDDELTATDYSVASIAVAPSDPDVVAIAVGDDFNPDPGTEPVRGGRVLWSTDGGATWRGGDRRWFVAGNQAHRAGREQLAIDPLDPNRALFGTQRDGLWETTDAGATWQQVPTGVVPDGVTDAPETDQAGVSTVTWLAREGQDRSVAVVGVTGDGIHVRAGSDGTWTRIAEVDDLEFPSSATVAGDDVLVSVNTDGSRPARLLRLVGVAGGEVADTEVVEVDTPIDALGWIVTADPTDPDHLVLGDGAVRDGHFWTSVDGGATWTAHDIRIETASVPWLGATDLDQYMTTGRFAFDPVRPGRLWFAEGMGMWRTDDLAADEVVWTSDTLGIEEVVVSDIVVPPGGSTFVAVADRQGFAFPDTEHLPDRTLIDEGFASGATIDYSGGDPSRLAWVGAQSNLPSWQVQPRGATSDDGGSTWVEMGGMNPSMYGGEVAVSATDPDRMVWLPAQRFGQPNGELYSSGDGGRSWQEVATDPDLGVLGRNFWWFSRRSLAADRVDPTMYLMGNDARLARSDDGGLTWATAPFGPPCTPADDCHVVGALESVPGRAGHLWASTGRGGLHRTDDGGDSEWEPVGDFHETRSFGFGAPIGDSDEPAVYVDAQKDEDGRFGVWRSVDGGRNWTLVTESPGGLAARVNVVTGDPDVAGRVYVGFAGAGVVYGDDTTLPGD